MTPISFAINDETQTAILTLFDNAEKSIYLSVPQLKWGIILAKEVFYDVIKRTCERGVNVYILTGENFVQSTEKVVIPSRCFVRYVNRFGPKIKEETVLWNIDNLIGEKLPDGSHVSLGEKRIFVHNQQYLVMDERVAMIGTFYSSLSSSSYPKIHPFPVSSFVKVDKELFDFIQLNWNTMGKSTMASPHRFFFSRFEKTSSSSSSKSKLNDSKLLKNPEHERIIQLISNSKKSLFIQSQFFASHESTQNTIAHALVLRLVKAYQNSKEDPFRCIILTNVDCPTNIRNFYCSKQIYLTVDYLLQMFRKLGLADPLTLKEDRRFFLGSVTNQREMTYFEGSVIIVDEETALVTSSALHDYSIGKKSCNELGVLIQNGEKNQLVTALYHQLLQTHLCLLDHKGEIQSIHKNKTMEDYIDLCYRNQGRIKRFRTCSPELLKRYKWADYIKRKLLGDII